ncbi:hypothetical protein ES703_116202 [subsurface metagenome]
MILPDFLACHSCLITALKLGHRRLTTLRNLLLISDEILDLSVTVLPSMISSGKVKVWNTWNRSFTLATHFRSLILDFLER